MKSTDANGVVRSLSREDAIAFLCENDSGADLTEFVIGHFGIQQGELDDQRIGELLVEIDRLEGERNELATKHERALKFIEAQTAELQRLYAQRNHAMQEETRLLGVARRAESDLHDAREALRIQCESPTSVRMTIPQARCVFDLAEMGGTVRVAQYLPGMEVVVTFDSGTDSQIPAIYSVTGECLR